MPMVCFRIFSQKYRAGYACFVMALLLTSWPAAIGAADAPASEERRSSIHEADGYAYLAGDKTLNDIRTEAMADAKRSAVAMARSYLASNTVVENYVLKQDRVEVSEAGAVTVLEMKDHGLEDNQRYHVWIKAEVGFEVPGTVAAGDKEGPLTVRLWSDKTSFRAGEEIVIYLQGNRDFYGRIVNIAADGSITQLLPNAYRKKSRFKGGETYRIPSDEDRFSLVVSPPFGTEQIVVYASEAPLGDVALTPAGGGLEQFSGSREALSVQTRAIKVAPVRREIAAAGKTEANPIKPASKASDKAGGGALFYERTLSLSTAP
jgi:hypothetical protein